MTGEQITLYMLKGRMVAPDGRFGHSVRNEMRWRDHFVDGWGREYPAGEYTFQRTAIPVRDIFTGEKLIAYGEDLEIIVDFYDNEETIDER